MPQPRILTHLIVGYLNDDISDKVLNEAVIEYLRAELTKTKPVFSTYVNIQNYDVEGKQLLVHVGQVSDEMAEHTRQLFAAAYKDPAGSVVATRFGISVMAVCDIGTKFISVGGENASS